MRCPIKILHPTVLCPILTMYDDSPMIFDALKGRPPFAPALRAFGRRVPKPR
jgi:hypothetical protein